MTNLTEITPDWLSPPGDTIADILEERGWSPQVFAEKAGISLKRATRIISGDAQIDNRMARTLSRVLGSTTRFWIAREANYRAGIEFRQSKAADDPANWVDWLEMFPISVMMKNGLIPKRARSSNNKPVIVEDLLRFFSVASPAAWTKHYTNLEASFRRASNNHQKSLGAVSAWLMAGERAMESVGYSHEQYSSTQFEKSLWEIRKLTKEKPDVFEPEMKKLCSEAGVNLALVPAIPRAGVSGVARWIDWRRPLIQLSLYGKTNDRFWFTFFHEAAHILLHPKAVFLDNDHVASSTDRNLQEQEADEFAADMLISERHLAELRDLPHTKTAVQAFAKRIGIHPGIVVGRMQHEKFLPYQTRLNALKASFTFKN